MVSTPLADPSGTIVTLDGLGAGTRRHTDLETQAPVRAQSINRHRYHQKSLRKRDLHVSTSLYDILDRIAARTREAMGAETCALFHHAPSTGALQPSIVAGSPLAFSLASAAMNPLPDTEPVQLDLADHRLAGCMCSIPTVGILLVTWVREGAEPDLGIVELAARLVGAAVDQERAGTLDLAAWRFIDSTLNSAGEAIVAHDAAGRLVHISPPARDALGLGAVSSRKPVDEAAFIRSLDLRDQWGLRIDPSMLPSSRLRAGKPAPDLVVSAHHHRTGRQWLLLHAEAVRDGNGMIAMVLTTLRDFAIAQRFGEAHWLRSRIAEHLHQRPIDLAAIEHDIAAFIEGTCSIELRGEPSRLRSLESPHDWQAGVLTEPDAGATELRMACGHLHRYGPEVPFAIGRTPAAVTSASHAVDIPITGDDEILGRMKCKREASRPCFGDEELEFLTDLAEQVGLAVAVSRLRASLHAGELLLLETSQRLLDAEETERRRMALSIHDGLAQVAASVCQQLEVIAHRFEPSSDAEGQELQRARDLAQRTVQEARQLIAGLRPVALDACGLGSAVREDIEALRCDGRMVRYMDGLAGARFAPDVELDVYRVVQEALSNARKYAGVAPIEVTLERRDDAIHFEIRDYGVGFDPSAPMPGPVSGSHVGLGGMHERIARQGGTLRIESEPARGTRVRGEVPI